MPIQSCRVPGGMVDTSLRMEPERPDYIRGGTHELLKFGVHPGSPSGYDPGRDAKAVPLLG